MDYVRNAWYAVLDESELPRPGRIVKLTRFSTDMILWRHEGGVTLQEDRCPHKGAPLSLGKVEGGRVRCRYHGMEFDGDGRCRRVPQLADQAKIPTNFCANVYKTRLAYGLLWLWWGDAEPTAELPFFDEIAGEKKLTACSAVAFPASFLRVMESHFDVYHVDHLHGWPLRLGEVVKESRVEVLPGRRIRCENVYENPVTKKVQASRATVLFPCLSLQEGGPSFAFKILAAATPIDEKTTWFFMRHYFWPFRLPIVGALFNGINNLASIYRVLPEDAMVQSRQKPFESGMGSDRLILPADRGIAEYWKMHRESVAAHHTERARRLAVVQPEPS